MRLLYILIFMVFCWIPSNGQHRYPFQWWNVPDCISEKLDSVYGEPDAGAGRNVRKLGIYDDFEFQNGVYSYRGMGPHFRLKYFLYYDNKFYFFKTYREEYNPCDFLKEWNLVVRSGNIKMRKADIVEYSAAILQHYCPKVPQDTTEFVEAVPMFIDIMLDSCYNDDAEIKAVIYAIFLEKQARLKNMNSVKYKQIPFSSDLLSGKWYFQTQICTERQGGKKYTIQRVCIDVPEIELCSKGYGKVCSDDTNNTFRWYSKGKKNHIKGISKKVFPKSNMTLRLKYAFHHNGKIFIELESGNVVYVLSQNSLYAR